MIVVAAPATSPAQQRPDPAPAPSQTSGQTSGQGELFSAAARRGYYEQSKLSTSRALLYSALPGMGNYYAQDYFTGTIWMAAFGFGALFLGYGLGTDQAAERWIGLGLIGGAYAGALLTTPGSVEDYNRDLRVQYGLEREGVRLRLGWSWSF